MKYIYIITGGTMVHVTPHFSLCSPAYGKVGSDLLSYMQGEVAEKGNPSELDVILVRTKMAGENLPETKRHLDSSGLLPVVETNADLETFVRGILSKPETACIVMAAAVCDYQPEELTGFEETRPFRITEFGKDKKRLHKAHDLNLKLSPSAKIIRGIKETRPDVCLVTFKTTAGLTEAELAARSRDSLEKSSSDFVLGNDIHNEINIILSSGKKILKGAHRQDTLKLLCSELFRRL